MNNMSRRSALFSYGYRHPNLVTWTIVLVIFAGLVTAYGSAIRPWFYNWGSTSVERQMPMPGDDLNPNPRWQTTRALTIDAPAETVWAWLIQHGQGRAGFYSYTWLENIVAADIHNVDELRPEWQKRAVGDPILMASPDLLAGRVSEVSKVDIALLDAGRMLVVMSESGGVGSRVLVPIDADTTRLVWRERDGSRGSGGLNGLAGDAFNWFIWDPMHFTMQHQMMLGLKARAEGHAEPARFLSLAAQIGWIGAGLALAACFALLKGRSQWILVPVIGAAPALVWGNDPDAALAVFLALGITIVGGLRFGRAWWLIGAAVFLVLLLTNDAYIVFGGIFVVILLAGLGLSLLQFLSPPRSVSQAAFFSHGARQDRGHLA